MASKASCIVLGLLLLLSSCAAQGKFKTLTLTIETVSGARVDLSAEIARTAQEQERGFMERKNIPEGTGMIFVYTADQRMHFWMKNTPHPLSIAYIDSSGTIREIYDMVPFNTETVSSVRSLRYALEVPAGWFERAGIGVGDSLTPESLSLLR